MLFAFKFKLPGQVPHRLQVPQPRLVTLLRVQSRASQSVANGEISTLLRSQEVTKSHGLKTKFRLTLRI